jgi:hypothetical protein
MNGNNLKRYGVRLLFFFLLLLFFLWHVYDFLDLHRPSNPGILIVEGWLPEHALDQAKKEFLSRNYRMLLTTGFPYHDGFLMGSGGKMEFDMGKSIIPSHDSLYVISLLIRGTKARHEFAHIRLYADSIKLGENYTTRKKREFIYRAKMSRPPCIIRVEFDNDTYSNYRDRNLYFYSVSVNNQIFPANNEKVAYSELRNGAYHFRQHLNSSTAVNAYNYLINNGMPDSLMAAVESLNIYKSKTYTSAMDVKRWMLEKGFPKNQSITIFTQGMHARRSYISFKKAFGNEAEIGVISLPDPLIAKTNWWKTCKGWKKVLYETVGVVYASIVL